MRKLREEEYRAFARFDSQWALVTAGTPEHYNSCTVSWGSIGNIWGRGGKSCPIITVYVHPSRYTSEFLRDSGFFTVGFYPGNCRAALGYMGSHSGRTGDKAAAAGLTPVAMGQSMTYAEAERTFLCRKLYQHQLSREDLAPEIREYYASRPETFPDFQGGWQPHIVFIGEVIAVEDGAAE